MVKVEDEVEGKGREGSGRWVGLSLSYNGNIHAEFLSTIPIIHIFTMTPSIKSHTIK